MPMLIESLKFLLLTFFVCSFKSTNRHVNLAKFLFNDYRCPGRFIWKQFLNPRVPCNC